MQYYTFQNAPASKCDDSGRSGARLNPRPSVIRIRILPASLAPIEPVKPGQVSVRTGCAWLLHTAAKSFASVCLAVNHTKHSMCWVPPQVLAHAKHGLPMFEGTLPVRSADLRSVVEDVTWFSAYAMAVQGRIAAKCSAGGRVRYFRMLSDSERTEMAQSASTPGESFSASRSTVVANTRLGAYREAVESVVQSANAGPYGEPGIERVIIGHVWQLHLAHV